mmetsp:Transcript_77727/g.155654  ORF Transcript_77727/g.155654 Transcript_77727/m.155654 type:complete len:294 (+) Transcript_77727:3232-4113(+)
MSRRTGHRPRAAPPGLESANPWRCWCTARTDSSALRTASAATTVATPRPANPACRASCAESSNVRPATTPVPWRGTRAAAALGAPPAVLRAPPTPPFEFPSTRVPPTTPLSPPCAGPGGRPGQLVASSVDHSSTSPVPASPLSPVCKHCVGASCCLRFSSGNGSFKMSFLDPFPLSDVMPSSAMLPAMRDATTPPCRTAAAPATSVPLSPKVFSPRPACASSGSVRATPSFSFGTSASGFAPACSFATTATCARAVSPNARARCWVLSRKYSSVFPFQKLLVSMPSAVTHPFA